MLRTLALGAAVSVAYVAAALVGFRFAFVAEQISTVWAPTGIGIAALLLLGVSMWPAVWIGAFAANALSDAPLWTAAVVASGNTLEAVAAGWTLRRFPQFDHSLRRINDVVAYTIVGAGLSSMLSASVGVVTLCAAGVQSWSRFSFLWRDWWFGDAIGALIVGPVILTVTRQRAWSRDRWVEASLLIIGVALTTHLVFSESFGLATHPLEYVIFPFVIAAAMRSGQPTTALVVFVASGVSIWHTVRGVGPFASPDVHDSLILVQAFMGVLGGTGLVLAAATAERITGDRRRAAAHSVGEILAGSPNLTVAAPEIVRAVCRNLEWQVAALWLVDPERHRLQCLAVWTDESTHATAFVALTESTEFPASVGLPGRVWSSGDAHWIPDVTEDTNFPRAPVARASGLHGAFGFPIRLGHEVLGVIECFNRRVLPPDSDLLLTMSAVGNQIGQFIGRMREQAAVGEANRAKDEFLATLSHELRTPLNAIVGWTRLLLDGKMDQASSRRALEVIDRNAQLQTQLVGDILDVSRIITGGVHLNLRPVDLETVVGSALDAIRPAAVAKGVQLLSRLAASNRVVQGDPERLQQVAWNLLANAVKFTASGGKVTAELDDGSHGRVCMRVRDDGAGIDSRFLPHVFERFRQADGSLSRQHGGLGLGLAIVRHLVELHGGTVNADSPGPGRGSTFTVELPALIHTALATRDERDRPIAEGSADLAAVPFAGYRLLVVDDHEDTRDLMSTLLSSLGAHVDAVSSVPEALERLDVVRPDAVLADIGMPGSDGFDLIRELRRRDTSSGTRLPAAAITAYASEDDRARVLAAGFDCYVPKPFSAPSLIAAVQSICSRRS